MNKLKKRSNMNMNKKEKMHAMSMQEKREVNGGSLTVPSLKQIISDALKGVFTLFA